MLKLLISFSLLSCASNSQHAESAGQASDFEQKGGPSDFRLDLLVQGAPLETAKLLGVYGNQNYLVDSAISDDQGRFVFNIDSLLPAGFYYLMLTADNSYFQLIFDKDQHIRMETVKGDLVNSMKVDSGLNNRLLYKNLKFEADFSKRLDPVNKQLAKLKEGSAEYRSVKTGQDALVAERKAHIQWFADNYPDELFTKFKLSGQNPELTYPRKANGEIDKQLQIYHYRNAFWDNVDFNSPATIRTPVFANKLRKYMLELTPQVADSLIKYADLITAKTLKNKELFKFTVNWIALEYKVPKSMGTEALYVHMIDRYWTDELAFWSNPKEIKGLRSEIALMKPSLIGQVGQDIRAKNEKGEYVNLYSLNSDITVLYIFSYDCEHCQKETPDMVRVYNQWKERGMRVFSLCIDKDSQKWSSFLRSNNMDFVNVIDPERESRYDRKYHIDITPEVYVMDRDHRIIASNLSPDQLPQFLENRK